LRLYDGSVIKPLGQYTFEVQRLTFQKVSSYQKPLICGNMSEFGSHNHQHCVPRYSRCHFGPNY